MLALFPLHVYINTDNVKKLKLLKGNGGIELSHSAQVGPPYLPHTHHCTLIYKI